MIKRYRVRPGSVADGIEQDRRKRDADLAPLREEAEQRRRWALNALGLEEEQAAEVAELRPELAPARRVGRQPWTSALYDARRADAVERAGGIDTDEAVAPHFRGLNARGDRGMEPASLARLRRKRARDAFPE